MSDEFANGVATGALVVMLFNIVVNVLFYLYLHRRKS